jgi:hypothetical protein
MILGQVAEQIDASRLFPASQAGGQVSEPEVDAWVRGAVQSVERWRKLFDAEVGIRGDTSRLKPSLTSEHFKAAYRLATEHHGIPLRESRNSQNQFVAGVYNFDAPDAFRDPVFRPSRTMHVVFDREIFAAVGGQDLGTVRGQPIRPLLTGFGESFTDWLFQTAMQARQDESAFSLQAGKDWSEGPGWLLVYALRWLGRTRRLPTPDSLAACFIKSSGEVKPLSAREAMLLVQTSDQGAEPVLIPSTDAVAAARKCAQETLRDLAASRGPSARSSANLSLLLVASVSLPDAWYAENARDWIKSQLGSGPWGALTEEVSKRLFGTKGMVDLAELETIAQAHNVKPEEVHAVLTSLTAQPGPTVRRVLYRLDDPQHSEIPLDEAIEHLSQRESSPDHWRAWAQKIGVAWRWHKQA